MCLLYGVQASKLYSSVDRQTALVETVRFLFWKTLFLSLPKAEEVRAMRSWMSPLSFWPSMVKIGTSGWWDDCRTMIWVLGVLTLSPRALYMEVNTFSGRCRASGV